MKNILLVEDDYNKIKQIEIFLKEASTEIPSHHLEVKKSYQSGLDAILNGHRDLILLDMSMHNFDKSLNESGGEFMKFAGEDILKEMIWHDINVKTIIVTQYDLIGDKTLTELKKVWNERYKDVYVGTVYYSANESNWKLELLNLIKDNL